MPTSRRRFLAVAGAAGAAVIAGCNEGSQPERDATVTPVDVPRSAADVLDAVEGVPVPSIPSATIVSDAHRRSVVRHVSERLRTTEAALAVSDVTTEDVGVHLNDDAPIRSARAELDRYTESPSRRQYRRLEREFENVATILGYVRAATGDLGPAGVRDEFATAETEFADLSGETEYRLASPVRRFLPTLEAVESALDRGGDQRNTARRAVSEVETDDEAVGPSEIAAAWRSVELLRLETTNAAGYAATALDPSSPPRADAIVEVVGDHLDVLASLDVPRRADGQRLPARVRTVLSTVRARRSDVLSAADPTNPETARRVELLLDAVRIRGQLDAFSVAAESTFSRLDGEEFPVERIPEAKDSAVDRLETLAAADPLQRHLGRLAEDMVTYADRLEPGQGTNPVASAHFMYEAAREFADLSLSRGDRVAAALEVDATPTP